MPNLPVADFAYDMTSDGGRILYRRAPWADSVSGVHVVDIATRADTILLADSEAFFASDCRFSPDGLQIAYTRNFKEDIYVRNLSSGEDTRVTFTSGNATSPDWDPTGSFLVYRRVFLDYGEPDSSAGLHVVDVETLSDRALRRADGSVVFGFQPRWSPDGKNIAFFVHHPLKNGINGSPHIYVVSVDGSLYRDLTPGDSRNNETPLWLDSDTILFESYSPSSYNVHETQSVELDGSGRVRWPFDLFPAIGYAAVSLSGQCVYSWVDSTNSYYVLYVRDIDDASGTTSQQVTGAPANHASPPSVTVSRGSFRWNVIELSYDRMRDSPPTTRSIESTRQ